VAVEELWQRIVGNFFARLDGPMHFRFILQPFMALLFATLDGLKDAKAGKPAYLWAVIGNPEHRRELLRDGWKHFGKIFCLAVILDLVYQLKVNSTVYPGEILLVALILAVVPYMLLRGPVNRIARLFRK
jgi:hypothetical protein